WEPGMAHRWPAGCLLPRWHCLAPRHSEKQSVTLSALDFSYTHPHGKKDIDSGSPRSGSSAAVHGSQSRCAESQIPSDSVNFLSRKGEETSLFSTESAIWAGIRPKGFLDRKKK